jgi:hypothetical protein
MALFGEEGAARPRERPLQRLVQDQETSFEKRGHCEELAVLNGGKEAGPSGNQERLQLRRGLLRSALKKHMALG